MSSRSKEHESEPSHGHAKPHAAPHGSGSHEEAHEGAPEWLISFADNVALMMGFFVILLAMNMSPKGDTAASEGPSDDQQGTPPAQYDAIDLAIALREAFNNPVNAAAPAPHEIELAQRILARQSKGKDNPGVEDPGISGDNEQVQAVREGNFFKEAGVFLFDEQATAPGAADEPILREIAERMKGISQIIEVRGHASAAEAFSSNDSGAALSFARALEVGRELNRLGVEWAQMRLVACGDGDRLKTVAYNAKTQRFNQRVEVTLSEDLMQRADMRTIPEK